MFFSYSEVSKTNAFSVTQTIGKFNAPEQYVAVPDPAGVLVFPLPPCYNSLRHFSCFLSERAAFGRVLLY